MIHLLRARSIVHDLVCGCHRASYTDAIEGLNAAVFLESLSDRLVFGELVHDHLLMGLLGGKHI